MSSQVEICNIWRNPNGLLQSFFLQVQWNRCSYLFETGSNAGFGCWSFMTSKAKKRKLKIGLPNSTEISSPTRLCAGSNWVGIWTCASLWEKKWVQFIRVVILLWIRPSIRYQATVPARSIISAGPWDGCSNAVINGFVRPSNLSADTEGLNNHERNEDRRRLFPHRQKSQLKLRNFWMGVKCQKWCG